MANCEILFAPCFFAFVAVINPYSFLKSHFKLHLCSNFTYVATYVVMHMVDIHISIRYEHSHTFKMQKAKHYL